MQAELGSRGTALNRQISGDMLAKPSASLYGCLVFEL